VRVTSWRLRWIARNIVTVVRSTSGERAIVLFLFRVQAELYHAVSTGRA
jgi:hypothetical protein